MRTNLKVFRVKHNMTQAQFAERLGCNRQTYSSIELGERDGRQSFWKNLQKVFNVPDSEMWGLMANGG